MKLVLKAMVAAVLGFLVGRWLYFSQIEKPKIVILEFLDNLVDDESGSLFSSVWIILLCIVMILFCDFFYVFYCE